jgi:hypothetical protein
VKGGEQQIDQILVPFYLKPLRWYALEIVAYFECPFVQFHLKQNTANKCTSLWRMAIKSETGRS